MGRPKKYTSGEERRRAKQLSNYKYRKHLEDRQRMEKTEGKKATDVCVHKGPGSGNGGLLPMYSEVEFVRRVEQYTDDVLNDIRQVVTPSMYDLAVYLDIDHGTLLEYKRRGGLYAQAMSRAHTWMVAQKLGCLYTLKNTKGVQFDLSVNHGMIERKETNVHIDGKLLAIQGMTDEEIDRYIEMRLPRTTSSGLSDVHFSRYCD
jgi:hypothetical protein